MSNSISIGSAYLDQKIVGGDISLTAISATTLAASGATTLNGNVAAGNASTDLIGFWGVTAVDQPAAITDSTDTTTTTSTTTALTTDLDSLRVKFNALLASLREIGIITA